MKSRTKVSRKTSKRIFRKTAAHPLRINIKPVSSRGGIRL